MKKTILSVVVLTAILTLFSFKKVENNSPKFKEVIEVPIGGGVVGKFTRYETSGTTSDKGTWNYRNETANVVSSGGNMESVKSIISKY